MMGPAISPCSTVKSGPSFTGCIQGGGEGLPLRQRRASGHPDLWGSSRQLVPSGGGTFQSRGLVFARLPDGPPLASMPLPPWGACFSWWELQDSQSWQRPIALTS